jgi:hypothetical protein
VGIGRQRDICGREVGEQLVVRGPPGERHVVIQAELGRERAHLVEAVARADERGVPVVRPEISQRHEGLERVVDAVLRAHDAEVAQEMLLAALKCGVGGAAAEAAQVGRAPHHEHALRNAEAEPGRQKRLADVQLAGAVGSRDQRRSQRRDA